MGAPLGLPGEFANLKLAIEIVDVPINSMLILAMLVYQRPLLACVFSRFHPQLDKSWSSLVPHLEDLPYHPTTNFGDVRIRTWFLGNIFGTVGKQRREISGEWLSHLPKKNCRVCGDQRLISMVENKTIFDTTSHLLSIKDGWKRPRLQMMFPYKRPHLQMMFPYKQPHLQMMFPYKRPHLQMIFPYLHAYCRAGFRYSCLMTPQLDRLPPRLGNEADTTRWHFRMGTNGIWKLGGSHS